MGRLAIFHAYKNHAWLCKSFNKLKADDLAFCEQFINDNDLLDKKKFDALVNRLFMDDKIKPKNWKIISELLSCSNSAL